MAKTDSAKWITVRKDNLKYFDSVQLFYKSPSGNIMPYKPAGMHFSDQELEEKPFLGDLYIRPEDKVRCLQEAQKGFSMQLSQRLENENTEGVKADLVGIVGETLSEPRSGTLRVVPEIIASVIDAYSAAPEAIRHLARTSHIDYTTAIHSINVMALTVSYGFYVRMPLEEIRFFGLAALLHDVGKTETPIEILTAARKLSDTEFERIKQHPVAGADILSKHGPEISAVIPGALEHHEKLDGSGYPYRKTELSDLGKILGVIGCYEALTNDGRPYRSAMPPLRALELLKKETDANKFDRVVFENFAYSLTANSSSKEVQKNYSAASRTPNNPSRVTSAGSASKGPFM